MARTLRRPLRLPTDADVTRLLAAGWCPTPRLGWWREGADAPRWWESALRVVDHDDAARSGPVDAHAPTRRHGTGDAQRDARR